MSRQRCCPQRRRPGLAGPLFRWGFTALALFAFAPDQVGAALFTGFLAWIGWQTAPNRGHR